MNTPISPETAASILEDAKLYFDKAFIHSYADARDGYIAGATAYAPYKERCEELERWKREAKALLDPLLDYGLSKEAQMPLGASIPLVILQRAKQFQQAKKALERIDQMPNPRNRIQYKEFVALVKTIAANTLATWKEEGGKNG